MNQQYRKFIDPIPNFSRQLPEGVYSLSTEAVKEILNISQSTLSDFKECLNTERPRGWDYSPGQHGLTIEQLQVLAILNSLVRTLGRRAAQKHLHKAIEHFYKQQETENG